MGLTAKQKLNILEGMTMTVPETLTQTEEERESFIRQEQTVIDMTDDLLDGVYTGEIELSADKVNELELRKTRSMAHILLNSQRDGGDSDEMLEIKKYVGTLEFVLSSQGTFEVYEDESSDFAEELHETDLERISVQYEKAIEACRNYIAVKNPRFAKGKARLKAVKNLLQRYETEKKILDESMKEGVTFTDEDISYMDVFRKKQEITKAGFNEAWSSSAEVSSLSYGDFASIAGMHAGGYIKLDGNTLAYTKNISGKSRSNMCVRRKLYALCLRQLGERITPELETRLQLTLGLDYGDSSVPPLEAGKLREVITEVNRYSSDLEQVLSDENADEVEKETARMTSELLGYGVREAERSRTTKDSAARMTRQINMIMKRGNMPALSPDQMDKLMGGNIPLVRDRIYSALRSIEKMTGNLGGSDPAAVLSDTRVFNRIAALAVWEAVQMGEAGHAVAEVELQRYIMEQAFVISGQKTLQNSFKRVHVGELAVEGSAGLDELIEQRKGTVEEWKGRDAELKTAAADLTVLCDSFREIRELEMLALERGLKPGEAGHLKELGAKVQNIIRSEGDKIAQKTEPPLLLLIKGLKNTRFAFGYGVMMQQFMSEADIAKDCTRIAESCVYKEEKKKASVKERPSAQYSGFGQAEAAVAEVLMLQRPLADYMASVKTQKERLALGASFGALYHVLKNMDPMLDSRHTLTFGDKTALIMQKKGKLYVSFGGNEVPMVLQCGAQTLAKRLESDICSEPEVYGKTVVSEIIMGLEKDDPAVPAMEATHSRKVLMAYVGKKTGLKLPEMNNLPTDTLQDAAKLLSVSADATTEYVTRLLKQYSSKGVHINSQESLELLKKMQKEELHVHMPPRPMQVPQQENTAQWTEEEKKVLDFLSDLVYSSDSWQMDTAAVPGIRMAGMLAKHVGALLILRKDRKILDKMLDKFPPGMGMDGMKEMLGSAIGGLLEKKEIKEQSDFALMFGLPMMLNSPDLQKNYPDLVKELVEREADIDAMVLTQMAVLQKQINKALFPDESGKQKKTEKEKDILAEEAAKVKDKNATDDIIEKMKRIKQGKEALDKVIEGAASGDSGQAAFVKTVMKEYFSGVSLIDQRAMLAAAFRSAKPWKEPPAGTSEKEREKLLSRNMSDFLGAALKGAGPLLQKMLQGMPENSLSEDFRGVIKDMKSRLAPIPDEFVKAQMQAIASRSEGRITDIEVKKSLGAASVGQAFLCTLHGPGIAPEGKDVVIKLLRPDVTNRMMREKDLMLKCASRVGKGMKNTYEGQLRQIEQELDLSIEAKNVQLGRVYDGTYDTLSSMKLDDLVEPTSNVMVIEKAPGETVDGYMEELKKEFMQKIEPFLVKDKDGKIQRDDRGRVRINMEVEELHKYAEIRTWVCEKGEQLAKRQGYVAQLAHVWVEEGIFGAGFYHGDLHAGNIMVNDEKATVIDFGNCTKLAPEQQICVTRMAASAAVGDAEGFLNSFHDLLENTPEKEFAARKDAFLGKLKIIMSLGNGEAAGQRIAAALLEAQKLGLELPSAISNFSSCQMRLQNTLDDMNSVLEDMQAVYTQLKKGVMKEAEKAFFTGSIVETFSDMVITEIANGSEVDVGLKRIKKFMSRKDEEQLSPANDILYSINALIRTLDGGVFSAEQEVFRNKEFAWYFSEKNPGHEELKKHYDQIVTGGKALREKCGEGLSKESFFHHIVGDLYKDWYNGNEIGTDDIKKLYVEVVKDREGSSLTRLINKLTWEAKAAEDKEKAAAESKEESSKEAIEEKKKAKEKIIAELEAAKKEEEELVLKLEKEAEDLAPVLFPMVKDLFDSIKAFQKGYTPVVVTEVEKLRESLYAHMTTREPDSFFYVMGDVINTNLKASLCRLGFWKSKNYMSIMVGEDEDKEKYKKASEEEAKKQGDQA
ncbi:MAG: hypothetical protein IKI75_03915 [Lachnospiraceae bacterium]|nr:hypothetical protein [Lachnospiraceae bacterium]